MEIWMAITIGAAFVQNVRFMLQKHLAEVRLSASGATFARFFYSAPLVAAALMAWLWASGAPMPALTAGFWAFALAGGLAQIVATVCVVAIFAHRNFAVGITFKKTEVLQTALIGFMVLGERVSPGALVAIGVGLAGLLLLSDPPRPEGPLLRRVFNRAAGLGIASGVLFGVSSVGYRGATLELGLGSPFLAAAVTLACVTATQAMALGAWLAWRQPGEIGRVLASWRVSSLVGLTSMLGSYGWFTAFALQTAAHVKALGQVELVFSFLAARFVFGQRTTRREALGMVLLVVSILLLVLVL